MLFSYIGQIIYNFFFTAYGTIVPILSSSPYMWFLDRFGLRVSVLSSSWLLAVGMVIRCFVPSTPGTKWIFLIHLGHIAIGIAGPPVETTPARISSVWFPPKQRTFATSVMVMAQFTGIALGFIVIPYLTRHYDIHTMFYVTAEMAMFSALLVTIYFPAHPPTPPSPSAETERTTFLSSLKALMCNRAFIVLAISGGLVTGANRCVCTCIWLNTGSGYVHYSQVFILTFNAHACAERI